MARFAHGHQPDVDPDLPTDEAAGPSVAPDSSSTLPSEETLPASQTMTRPIGSNFSDLGATFNGMARPPMDALSQSALDQGGQRTGSMANHTNDLTTVQNNVLAELNTGQFSGAALGHVQAMLSDITAAISAANTSVSGGGSTPGAEQALRASHLSILNAVNTDPVLANPTAPVTEPVAAPDSAPADKTADTAPDASSEETTNLAEAGDTENMAQTDENLDAAIAEMEALIAANPDLFVGLTVEDADEIVHQIQLELSQINKGDVPPGAAQNSSGDITDIVTGDINLASMIAQGQSGQQAVNIIGASETQAAPQVATIAVGDVPATIVTTEAPTIVVDHSQSGAPELAHHLHHTWG
ncbi:hypothetical protein KIP88_24050 [Bradyrhizobium sp. SRL28]|uniref:hypothetical protein n=1 Tax=Bradyrhizobium sp. SRL28 TaxID=2836178 RepID=UPI001BDE2FA1|nr:hypothetical protein [Bradyrhizobium sp. SRL28]MBT1513568.1 hypothetical protein [Bradyrhizobium sp. SRL28]